MTGIIIFILLLLFFILIAGMALGQMLYEFSKYDTDLQNKLNYKNKDNNGTISK